MAGENRGGALGQLEELRPKTRRELHRFVETFLGLTVVGKALARGNSAPLDYLEAAFFEEGMRGEKRKRKRMESAKPQAMKGDLVVWASRGGGKTMLGAAATLLDLIYKPGIQVRILGGSFAQSERMYEHLRRFLGMHGFAGICAEAPTQRGVTLVNGSSVELLLQSERSVRGRHVHILRCDELELFDAAVWEAAQLVPESGVCGGIEVAGRIEVFSTMHKPYGLMSELLKRVTGREVTRSEGKLGDEMNAMMQAAVMGEGENIPIAHGAKLLGKSLDVEEIKSGMYGGTRVFRWGAMDVAERCPAERPCEGCKLWEYCQGRAREARGFTRIIDLLNQRERVSDRVWDAEMMCRRPATRGCVFPGFEAAVGGKHVVEAAGNDGEGEIAAGLMPRESVAAGMENAPRLALSKANLVDEGSRFDMERIEELTGGKKMGKKGVMVGGMDFGMRNPLVMLWARVSWQGEAPVEARDPREALVEVLDEYCQEGRILEQNLRAIEARGWPRPEWIGVDPAGGQRNSHTGSSDLDVLRRRGYKVRKMGSTILYGLEIMHRRLDHGLLKIDSSCTGLIRAMEEYRYNPARPTDENPMKDGPDHFCDALRYLLINLEAAPRPVRSRKW